MKNKVIATTVCLLFSAAAQAQVSDPARRIHEKLQAFVASGEYNVSKGRVVAGDEVTGSKTTSYSFSQVFSVENSNDTTLLFPHLQELEMTLRSEAANAREVYLHDSREGDPLIKGVSFSFGGPGGFVDWQVEFGSRKNIRLLTLEEPDGYRYALVMVWEQDIKPDEQIGNHWMMNGTIFEVYGKKLWGSPFIRPSHRLEYTATMKPASDPTAPQTYEELLAKVRSTCDIYRRETAGGKTAAVVILHKMCDGYPHQLTSEQYNTLIEILSPFAETAAGQKHKDMFAFTCYTLYKKTDGYREDLAHEPHRPGMIISSTVTTAQLRKFVSFNSLIVNGQTDLQQVDCQISGTAPAGADSVEVRRGAWASEMVGKYPVSNGRFAFTCRLPKDEVCALIVNNGYATYFWADGQPLKADLQQRTVESSAASQQRNDFLNETEAERLRLLRIEDRVKLEAAIDRQRERFRSVIFSGQDDLLRAYALYKVYTELTLDELKPFVSPRFRYADHLLMAPVKEYVAGLEQRRPGTRYTDILLVDTLGGYHQLNQYVGKGYVVLHFWESWNRDQYDILPQLRTLYEKYHASKGLQILSLAVDAIPNGKSWFDRLGEERLPWPQLATKAAQVYGICSWPETVVISPDGTILASPRTVEELERVVEGLE